SSALQLHAPDPARVGHKAPSARVGLIRKKGPKPRTGKFHSSPQVGRAEANPWRKMLNRTWRFATSTRAFAKLRGGQ
ncbi:hypothetical protein, partial [Streptomyces sp. NPDC003688]